MKRFSKLLLLVVFIFSFISCADSLNEKIGYKIPDESEHPEKPYNDDNGGDNNNGDDDLPPDVPLGKFDISFDDEGGCRHRFSDDELSLIKFLPEPLDCLNDVIELTIQGIPSITINGLYLQICGNNIECEYSIPETFTEGVYFTKTLKVPLQSQYYAINQKDFYDVSLYYRLGSWNNSPGLVIRDYLISIKPVKNEGLVLFKTCENSNFDTDYKYEHHFSSPTIFSGSNVAKQYCNVHLKCNSPEDINNIYLFMFDWNKSFRICELKKGYNSIDVSFRTENSGERIGWIEMEVYKEDLNHQVALADFNMSCVFSDIPLYTEISGLPPDEPDANGKKFTLTFENPSNNFWYHHFSSSEISMAEEIPEELNCLSDCIEITVSGIPNMDVTELRLNENELLREYVISPTLKKDIKFKKTVRIPLSENFSPRENNGFDIRYYTYDYMNNSEGLVINDFSISARAVKNAGFIFDKINGINYSKSNIFAHDLFSNTCMKDNNVKKIANISLTCNSPVEISNLYFSFIPHDWNKACEEYRICKLVKGNNTINVSVDISSEIPDNNTIWTLKILYYDDDVNSPITLSNMSLDVSFSDNPLYKIVN